MNKRIFFHIEEGHTIDFKPRNDEELTRIESEILDDRLSIIILVTLEGKQVFIPKDRVKFYHIDIEPEEKK